AINRYELLQASLFGDVVLNCLRFAECRSCEGKNLREFITRSLGIRLGMKRLGQQRFVSPIAVLRGKQSESFTALAVRQSEFAIADPAFISERLAGVTFLTKSGDGFVIDCN